jgi:MFS family permease
MRFRFLTRTILLVSFVSLFTDIASEMLYPVMPVYLRSIGFSVFLIGVLEGIAEATAGVSKGYFGNLSDKMGRRVPFIAWGYSLSALSKPLMAAFTYPLWIFFARTLDRLGKGVRTSARDALLSDESSRENKGKVFGFHRAMDTAGAALGPLLALVFLYFYPGHYRLMFVLAFLPGLLAIILSLLLRDKKKAAEAGVRKPSFFGYLAYWKVANPVYKRLVIGLLAFTLFNSSDAFLLLAVKNQGHSDTAMIGLYIFYNLMYALLAFPFGFLADRIGMKRVLLAGLLVFAAVYFCMGFAKGIPVFLALFLFYSVYAAATEGISKALIANLADKTQTATAIGFYNSFASICALLSSSLAGLLWYAFSPAVMFMISGAGVACVVVYLAIRCKTAEKVNS